MKYSVTVDNQTYEIEVSQDGQVWIDGQPHDASLRAKDSPSTESAHAGGVDDTSRLSLMLDERTFHARVGQSSGDATWSVSIGGRVYDARVRRLIRSVSKPTQQIPSQECAGRIVAPLPGLVLDVLIQAGQRVQAGDSVILLESMKMQLEVRTPLDGVIAEALVKPGQEVVEGQLLMVIHPIGPLG